jgi:hypothetical protein
MCAKCKHIEVRSFADAIVNCPMCQGPMMLPGPDTGFVDRSVQKEIMYAADAGMNPAIGGGLEFGISENKSLGNPVISIEWAAMHEQGFNSDGSIPDYAFENGEKPYLGGQDVKCGYMWFEPETCQMRAYMDRKDFIEKVLNWYNIWKSDKKKWHTLQEEAHNGTKTIYTWEKTGAKYIQEIESLGSTQDRWKQPIIQLDENAIMEQVKSVPAEQKVVLWYSIVSKHMKVSPDILEKVNADIMSLTRYGITTNSKLGCPFRTMDDIYNFMLNNTRKINVFEKFRGQVNGKA